MPNRTKNLDISDSYNLVIYYFFKQNKKIFVTIKTNNYNFL